ncbi:MAG TPA: phospholipid carrier-dependent glycosyltransferase [Cytophagales bacterium]|jgi:4-amino-4-deoxy-L-arabinose transferase-like glycosyltransferase|nr:phospholipid carrier-dependent glycosyltransferase [Cytophagales bacterium]
MKFSDGKLLILIFVLSFALFFSGIGLYDIFFLDEAKNAACAQEMLMNKSWIVPTFNGEIRTDKPPLHYYFMIISYYVFGYSPFAARFFSALFGFLSSMLVYYLSCKIYNKRVALLSLLVFISSIHITFQFHWAAPDPYLIFFMLLAFSGIIIYDKKKETKWLWIAFAAIGFGTLSKGPVSIVLPAIATFLYLIFTKKIRWVSQNAHRVGFGSLIVLIIVIPWYIMVHFASNGVWTEGFFLEHNFNRFLSEKEGHGGPFVIMFIFVLTGLLPFSAFIFHAVRNVWINRQKDQTGFFMLIIGLTIVSFFSISRTKLPGYITPSLPFFAIIIGSYIDRILNKNLQDSYAKKTYMPKDLMWIGGILVLILSIAIPIGIFIAFKNEQLFQDVAYLAFPFGILPVGALLAIYFMNKGNLKKVIIAYAGSSIIAVFYFHIIALPAIVELNPVNRSKEIWQDSDLIVAYQRYNPAYNFALQRNIDVIGNEQNLLRYIEEHPGTIILSTREKLNELERGDFDVLFEGKDLFENPTSVIFKKSEMN